MINKADPNTPLTRDAFMRRIHRQNAAQRWEHDIKSYTLLKKISFKSEIVDRRIAEIEARYPNVNWKEL